MPPQTVAELDLQIMDGFTWDQNKSFVKHLQQVHAHVEEGKACGDDLDGAYIAYGRAALLH